MIGPYHAYAVLDGHAGFECAEMYSNLLISFMQDNLPEILPDKEYRKSLSFWEELFIKGVSNCDKMAKGSSGKNLQNPIISNG